MSHDHSGHASCLVRKLGPQFQIGKGQASTRHDRCGRWLWRLVGRFGFVWLNVEDHRRMRLAALVELDQTDLGRYRDNEVAS
jgi:hypothetical protein